jgi:hypothetical protein
VSAPEPEVHVLKCWPEPFEAVLDGRKNFEVRKADRRFKVGDRLVLREWDPETPRLKHDVDLGECVTVSMPPAETLDTTYYTGRALERRITYITAGAWGLPVGLAVLGLGCACGLCDPATPRRGATCG